MMKEIFPMMKKACFCGLFLCIEKLFKVFKKISKSVLTIQKGGDILIFVVGQITYKMI